MQSLLQHDGVIETPAHCEQRLRSVAVRDVRLMRGPE